MEDNQKLKNYYDQLKNVYDNLKIYDKSGEIILNESIIVDKMEEKPEQKIKVKSSNINNSDNFVKRVESKLKENLSNRKESTLNFFKTGLEFYKNNNKLLNEN